MPWTMNLDSYNITTEAITVKPKNIIFGFSLNLASNWHAPFQLRLLQLQPFCCLPAAHHSAVYGQLGGA